MILSDAERIIRNYAAVQLSTHFRYAVVIDAINDAIAQWCVYVGYPRITVEPFLSLTANTSYIDVSDKFIQDIEAVYYETTYSRSLTRTYRGTTGYIHDTAVSVSPTDSTPTKYFYEEVMASNAMRKRLYIYNDSGLFAIDTAKEFPFIYTGLPIAFTTAEGDKTKNIIIPDPYVYDLKFFAAFIHYNRVGDDKKSIRQYQLWEKSKLFAYMMMNDATRDVKKRMTDGLAEARRKYMDRF